MFEVHEYDNFFAGDRVQEKMREFTIPIKSYELGLEVCVDTLTDTWGACAICLTDSCWWSSVKDHPNVVCTCINHAAIISFMLLLKFGLRDKVFG